MPDCPICGATHGTKQSVVSHISGSTDEDHRGIGFQGGWELLGSDGDHGSHGSTQKQGSNHGNHSSKAQSDNHGSVLYSEPTETQSNHGNQGSKPSSNQCCESPQLTGSGGDMFRLDSGDVIQLDDGDQICTNCDEVSEA